MQEESEDTSLFIEVLGDYPLIRVLNFLLIFRDFDYSLTEIAEESGVAWSTLHTVWPKLEELNFVKNTRVIGNAKMYKLNTENALVQDFVKFSDKLISDYTNEKILKEVVAV
ncbi:helix-turn-helix transcriptional regulator [Candidatus Woesearchaeota archaeon]|nr:helix-turn-helix transcriptional regulator [Candidatus Woesearchaeota archaeon]